MADAKQMGGVPAVPAIFEAKCRRDGAVAKGPMINEATAVTRRQAGSDVVVCGTDKIANRSLAQAIETAANGACKRHQPHAAAGAFGLPHFQPVVRPPDGHTFYEVDTRKAV